MGWYSVIARFELLGWSVEEVWLSTASHGDSMVISIRGDLDIVTSQKLDESLNEASATHNRLILDLSEVEFMDTSALAVIVGHWKRAGSAGGVLGLAGARYRYTKTLWITGLADRIPLYDNVEAGVAAQRVV
jgi:anti-sigma B factor antagonist